MVFIFNVKGIITGEMAVRLINMVVGKLNCTYYKYIPVLEKDGVRFIIKTKIGGFYETEKPYVPVVIYFFIGVGDRL